MTQLNQTDLYEIARKGIEIEQINNQINAYIKGFPFVNLNAPATASHGIKCFSNAEINDLIQYFDNNKNDHDILKFVPASGAASRMFKHLFEFVQVFDGTETAIQQLENDENFNGVGYLLKHINQFAFIDDLKLVAAAKGESLDSLMSRKAYNTIIHHIIDDEGLGYGSLPKALLKFHSYENEHRYAIEEHLVEAAHYCINDDKLAKVHFTISPEHRQKFEAVLSKVVPKFEKKFQVKYEIEFSEQKQSTDTIAVDLENMPFRDKDGKILFRPGGHGALIENLNELEADIIFIKNIDNIVPDQLRSETYRYKKAIGGLLLKLQEKTFDYLDILDSGLLEENELDEMQQFAANELMIYFPELFDAMSEIEKIDYLYSQLNRPMRVCGMVKNEGEPGGGPFWVKNSDGIISLQIVESSQIDPNNAQQTALVRKATHFNPVDLVCGTYSFNGHRFDLKDFIDADTGFISMKSKDGRDLKALELPGLWNGAMADWITIFVETPLITFNPVKTVNDLLRPQHQPAT